MQQPPDKNSKQPPPDKSEMQQPPVRGKKKRQPLDKDDIQHPPDKNSKQPPPDKEDLEMQQTLAASQKQQPPARGKKQRPPDKDETQQPPAASQKQQPPDKRKKQQPSNKGEMQQPSVASQNQQPPDKGKTQQPPAVSQKQQRPYKRKKQQPPDKGETQPPSAASQNLQPLPEGWKQQQGNSNNTNEDTPAEGQKSIGNQYWIKELCLFMTDKEILESPTLWLSDSVIYAASVLLSRQAKEIDGWQTPQCGKHFKYKPVNPRRRFIQILHDRGHWITVSNVDVHQGGVTDSINVFDSYQPSDVSLNAKKQVCAMIKSNSHEVKFDIINIMPQPNSCDCGAFAIACATELTYGFDPALCCWDVTLMRQHLLSCFESGEMVRFPITKTRCVPFGRRVKYMVSEKIYCICRMPNEKLRPMIQCENCFGWFHFDCVNYDSSLDWKCTNCLEFLRETVNDN